MEKEIIELIKELNIAFQDHYRTFNELSKKDWIKIMDRIGRRYLVKEMEKATFGILKKRAVFFLRMPAAIIMAVLILILSVFFGE